MPRFFIEVAYRGTRYSGFQVQENANTIQLEVEKALATLFREPVNLTGSSRTDAGVHALQNFFHFDFPEKISGQVIYKLNAILPADVVVKNIFELPEGAHSRFDARAREYEYRIYTVKNPFLKGLAHFYPYHLDYELMQEAAGRVRENSNFFAFSKTNTQVKNFNCSILKSEWIYGKDSLAYQVEGNRFLRGMVRLLTATMLKVGRKKLSLEDFSALLTSEKEKCGYSVPAEGLYLKAVKYPDGYFQNNFEK